MSSATFDAYAGVDITLIGGRVVNTPAFTVAEATAYTRMWSKVVDGESDLIRAFVDAFVERTGLGSATLDELGVSVDGLDIGHLTANEVGGLVGDLVTASWAEDDRERAKAQMRWWTDAPGLLGVSEREQLAEAGQTLAADYYNAMYGLAQDFCSRLHLSPEVRTWAVVGASHETSPAGTPT